MSPIILISLLATGQFFGIELAAPKASALELGDASPTADNLPPLISPVKMQSVCKFSFIAINYGVSQAGDVTLSGNSSNLQSIQENMIFVGEGTNRFVILSATQPGDSVITITATAPNGLTAETSFPVTVLDCYSRPPGITAIAPRFVTPGTPIPPIAFVVGDLMDTADSLKVFASSSNSNLFPTGNLTVLTSGVERQLIAAPVDYLTGQATITVTVIASSGRATATSFVIRVGRAIRLGPPALSADGSLNFRVFGEIGDRYELWESTNLMTWFRLSIILTNQAGWAEYAGVKASGNHFYRANWVR